MTTTDLPLLSVETTNVVETQKNNIQSFVEYLNKNYSTNVEINDNRNFLISELETLNILRNALDDFFDNLNPGYNGRKKNNI